MRLILPKEDMRTVQVSEKEIAVYQKDKLICVLSEDVNGELNIDFNNDVKVTTSPNNLSIQAKIEE